jgi:hypothetical protein
MSLFRFLFGSARTTPPKQTEQERINGCRDVVLYFARIHGHVARECMSREELEAKIDFPIGGFSPPEGRLARGFKPPAKRPSGGLKPPIGKSNCLSQSVTATCILLVNREAEKQTLSAGV